MPDVFVYYFLIRDRATGMPVSSKRRATLGAIESKGEPLLESKMAVDDSEVDALGFLVRSVGCGDPADELWGEIRSLKLRADSREREAKRLNDVTDRERKLILCEESRELRNRADRLRQLIQSRSERASGEANYQVAPAGEARVSQFFKPE
jgi:hypothetical protein